MFGLFKSEKHLSPRSLAETSAGLLAAARAAGDKRAELALSLIVVAEEAQKLQTSLQRIDDIYADRLEELSSEAYLYFPPNLSVRIEELRESFDEIYEGVDAAASRSALLVKELATAFR